MLWSYCSLMLIKPSICLVCSAFHLWFEKLRYSLGNHIHSILKTWSRVLFSVHYVSETTRCLAHFTTFSQVISQNLNFNDSSPLNGYGFKGEFTLKFWTVLAWGRSGQIDAYHHHHHHHCELLVPWHPGVMSWFLSYGLHWWLWYILQLFLSSLSHFCPRISLSCF